ncbi:MAG: hypothetical protein R3A46_12570 [Thermomicrobiales bacterium]
MTRLTVTILERWRQRLQEEWERASSISNPRHDLARDIDRLDLILGGGWRISITPEDGTKAG